MMEAFEALKADVARNKAAVRVEAPAVKKALVDLWDWAEGLVEAVNEQFEDHDETISEIIEGEGELLHAETSARIIETLSLGSEIAEALKIRLPPGDPLLEKIAAYGQQWTELVQHLGDITVPDEGEGEGEGDDAPVDDTETETEDDDDADE